MRIAIVSDIHGNLVALRAALSDIKSRKASRIVCLGDVAATGPQPIEVIEHLREMRCPCVMGNTDETLAKDLPSKFTRAGIPEEGRRRQEALDFWTRKRLTSSHRRYLSTFKPMLEVHLSSGQSLLCYHGSPSSNRDEIMPTTPNEELAHRLERYRADVFAGGHTHTQVLRHFLSSLVINPGSVGWSFQTESSGKVQYPSIAEYARVSSSGRTLSVEFVSVQYSLSDLRMAVHNSGMPDPDWWLSDRV